MNGTITKKTGGKDAWLRVDTDRKSYGVQDNRVWHISRGGFGMPDCAAGYVSDPQEKDDVLSFVASQS